MRTRAKLFRAFLFLTLLCAALPGCGVKRPHGSHPVTSSFGPFDLKTFQQFDTVALYAFTDAPSAPGSGQGVTTVLAGLLEPMGFTVINQVRLDQIAQQELGLNEEDARDQRSLLAIAKRAKAQAVILGEVGQWEVVQRKGPIVWVPLSPGITRIPRKEWEEASVAIAFKIIDVKSGETVFSGQGTFSEPIPEHPKLAVQQILVDVLARCFQHLAPVRTGLLGYKALMQDMDGGRVPVVTEIVPGSPVQRAGLQIGDVILACSDSAKSYWKTLWQLRNACSAEAGQTKSIQVARAKERVTIRATALARSSFITESPDGLPVRDLFAPL